MQEALATDSELARALAETVAKQRAEFEKATPQLKAWQRREAAPWLYTKDYKYFAPTVTTGADGEPQFAFVPTPALRRLQLLQALSLDVQTTGGGPDVLHVAGRTTGFQSPRSTAEAVAWYLMFGGTQPDKLAHLGQGGGLQGANSDWLWALPPAGMFRGTVSVGGYLLGAVRGAAANIVLTAAAEKVAEKFGPAAGAVVPFVPILVAILGHRGVGGAAFRRFARRNSPPKQVAGLPRTPNPHIEGKIPIIGARRTGVERATALEVELVRKTGRGTVDWTRKEIAVIKKEGRLPEDIVGHHLNSVAEYPEWAGDPRNIKFVRGRHGNLDEHGGAFQNRTQGPLIDRRAMIDAAGGSK